MAADGDRPDPGGAQATGGTAGRTSGSGQRRESDRNGRRTSGTAGNSANGAARNDNNPVSTATAAASSAASLLLQLGDLHPSTVPHNGWGDMFVSRSYFVDMHIG